MIDAELAAQAAPLLSTAIAELVEDEHLAMVSARAGGPSVEAHAERLAVLGADITLLARALGVILRRSRQEGA